MSVSGRIDELSVANVLQALSQLSRSGKLTVTGRSSQGVVVLREGKIIYAASTSGREALGNLLVCEKLINEETLAEALNRQHASETPIRLGVVLEDMGVVNREALRRVLQKQAEKVMQEILSWNQGFFKFDACQVEDRGEIAVDVCDFIVDEGVDLQHVLLHLGAEDEQEGELQELEQGDPVAPEPRVRNEDAKSLHDIMNQIRQPTFNAELTMQLLSYATRYVERAVLLINRPDGLSGMAQVGVDIEEADQVVRNLVLKHDTRSLLSQAVLSRETQRGPLEDHEVHHHLLTALGGSRPSDAVVMPLTVQGDVALVLYGDVSSGNIGSVDWLEAVMLQGSLALEKSMLERRVRLLEERLSSVGAGAPSSAELGMVAAGASSAAPELVQN